MVYGQVPRSGAASSADADDLALGADAETMMDEDYEKAGCTWCGDSLDGYWVVPQRLAWCRDCGALDDWKAMRVEYVKEMTRAERQRYDAAAEANPRYTQLVYGREGEVKLMRCGKCSAKKQGISEAAAITQAAQ